MVDEGWVEEKMRMRMRKRVSRECRPCREETAGRDGDGDGGGDGDGVGDAVLW